jgi:phosphoglycerate dehydrogenase-like enzyme
VKGAFSAVLGEFVALGMLWHSKNVAKFRENQKAHLWQAESIELVSNKVMAIVGYGNIGAHCAKAVKAFGTRVIGVKRRPLDCDELQRQNADEIVGLD